MTIIKIFIVNNIYRPPKDNYNRHSIEKFTSELNEILMDINRFKANILLTGDFNIDLLKINERSDFYDYLLTILSHGLLPIIIFPTRLEQNSASLIDSIFSNLSTVMYHSSGILLSDISDHLPYYFSINYDITHEVRTKRSLFQKSGNLMNKK